MNEMWAEIFAGLDRVPGRVGFCWRDLTTGEEMAYRADAPYLAASVIKLPICAAIARMAYDGRADFGERLPVRAEKAVPGCGTLQMMADEVDALSVGTLCRLMITVSDNFATNLLIDRFGIDALNREFAAMGLVGTQLTRKMFDAAAAARGLENRVVPREMVRLLAEIHAPEPALADAYGFVGQILLHQQIRHKIPGYLPGVRVANKTGEDCGITNDVGIVYASRPFAVAFACNETDVPEAERAIREISRRLVDAAGVFCQ